MDVLPYLLVFAILFASAVWLVARNSGGAVPSRKSAPETGNRVFFAQVHGIYHKNYDGSSRQAIIRRCRTGEELLLVPEPTNRYDSDAVKICRNNGEQVGYWEGNGRMAGDLATGWTYRVTIDEIYRFKENPRKHGVRLRVEVLTMSRRTEERKKRAAAKAVTAGG